MGVKIWSFVWGLAEATVFFIVPDVLISAVALKDLRKALTAAVFALLGALLGGTAMYLWGVFAHEAATRFLDMIPAISPKMISSVLADLRKSGVEAVFLGPVNGIPYKFFAVQAPAAGIGFLAFLLISIPARLVRFLLAAFGSWLVFGVLLKKISLKVKYTLLVLFWSVVYGIYWFLLYLIFSFIFTGF